MILHVIDHGDVCLMSEGGALLANGRLTQDIAIRSRARGVIWTGEFESQVDLASYIAPTDQPPPPNSYVLSWPDGRQVKVQIPSHEGSTRAQINGMELISEPA
jgi:hypothetical protein